MDVILFEVNPVSRRQFLKVSLAAGAALPIKAFGNGDGSPATPAGLPRRVLGRTGASVTILGMGAYIAHHEQADTRGMVETALDGGIRYFDCAPTYGYRHGVCEERLGELLKGVRDEIFLTTKITPISAQAAEETLHGSLQRLQTDHVDLLFMHGVGLPALQDTDAMLGNNGLLAYLRNAKRDGLARFIGMSIHPPHNVAQRILEKVDDLDVAMPFINYMTPATVERDKGEILEPCRRAGLGLVAMKVLGGNGQLANDYDLAFRYALSVPGVACATIGTKTVDEVRRALQAARQFRPLSADEMNAAEAHGRTLAANRSDVFRRFRSHVSRDDAVA